MSEFKPRRCRECGEGTIRPLAKEGRRMPFRNMSALLVPSTVAIPTCDACGNEWMALTTDLKANPPDNAKELSSKLTALRSNNAKWMNLGGAQFAKAVARYCD